MTNDEKRILTLQEIIDRQNIQISICERELYVMKKRHDIDSKIGNLLFLVGVVIAFIVGVMIK